MLIWHELIDSASVSVVKKRSQPIAKLETNS